MSDPINVPGFPRRITVHGRHLEMPADCTWHEYASAGRHLSTMDYLAHESLPWLIGDFINFGDAQFGERYAQALDLTEYTKASLTQIAYVARHVKPPNRTLPLSFMASVASKNDEEQKKLADQAVDEGLLQSEFRRLVRGDENYRKPIKRDVSKSAKHLDLEDAWEQVWAEHEAEWSHGTAKENAKRVWFFCLQRALGRHVRGQ